MTARLTALPRCRIFLLIAALLLAAGAAPAAAADSWRVHGKSEGLLHRLPDSSDWQPSSSGLELPPGTSLQASDGTAVLGRADNLIIMLSGSEFTLPAPATEIVFQRHGRIRYQIRPGSTRNFRVESPYLAIGIKGTRFDVLVSSAGAEVRVLEGRVVASTPDGRYRVELTPGQVARIGAAPGSVLEVQQVSGQSSGQASGQAFAPAPQEHPDAPTVRADAGGLVSPTLAAGYLGEPSVAVSESVAAVTETMQGLFGRLGAGARELLSTVEVVADDRLRSAPRTVVKGVRGLSRRAYGNVASRDSGGGSGGDTSGGGDSSASSSGSGGSSGDSSGGGGSAGGSSSGGSSGGSGSGGSSSGGGLGGAVGGLGGAVGGAVGGVMAASACKGTDPALRQAERRLGRDGRGQKLLAFHTAAWPSPS